jgi:hypothetical protein
MAEGGGVVVHYRSPGRFHDLVTCDISVNAYGVTNQIRLALDGGFIDSPQTMPFARDIARSFIRTGLVYQSDLDQVADVLSDLLHRSHADAEWKSVSKNPTGGTTLQLLKAGTAPGDASRSQAPAAGDGDAGQDSVPDQRDGETAAAGEPLLVLPHPGAPRRRAGPSPVGAAR